MLLICFIKVFLSSSFLIALIFMRIIHTGKVHRRLKNKRQIKIIKLSQAWQHTPLVPTFKRQKLESMSLMAAWSI